MPTRSRVALYFARRNRTGKRVDDLIDVSCSKVVVRLSRSASLPKITECKPLSRASRQDLSSISFCARPALPFHTGAVGSAALPSRPFVSVAGANSKTDLRLVLLLAPRTFDLDLDLSPPLRPPAWKPTTSLRMDRSTQTPVNWYILNQGSRTRLRRPQQPVPHPLRLSRPRPSTSHPEQHAEDLWQGRTHPWVRRSSTERNGDRSIPNRSIRSITSSPSPSSPPPYL